MIGRYRGGGLLLLAMLFFNMAAAAQETPPPGEQPGAAEQSVAVDPDLEAAIKADKAEAPEKPISISNAVRENVSPQAAKFIPDISFILDVGVGWFFWDDHIRQGGHAIDENGFTLQGLEMAVSGSVDPFFRYDMNFEFAHLHLEEAYLTSLSLPINMQIRLGYMNAAFGRQNPRHLHAWNFINPPLSHTRFMGEEHFSGLGGELSFLLPLPWYMTIGGQMLDTKPETAFRSGSFGTIDLTKSGKLDGLEDFVYVARIENFSDITDNWSLNWGLSGGWGQSPYVPDNRVDLYGTDLYIKWRPIALGNDALAVGLTLEYLFRQTQAPNDNTKDHGGYAQLDVQLARQWMMGVRGDYTDILSGTTPDPEKIRERQWRGSLVGSFIPTHFSRLKLQYDIGQEKSHDLYHAAMLQLEVGIGEHMAHKF
ncbi:MAG: hypothetical protein C4523_18410 [Myxococcales bacterium]|nr:MAG: hypothetical protein C4523_18410 [Myxococcales bacterium]